MDPQDPVSLASTGEVGDAVHMLIARALRIGADLRLTWQSGAVSCTLNAACVHAERLDPHFAPGIYIRLKVLCFMEGLVTDRPQAGETRIRLAGQTVVVNGRTTITVHGEELDVELRYHPAPNDLWLQKPVGLSQTDRIIGLTDELLRLSAGERAAILLRPARGRIVFAAPYQNWRCFAAIAPADVPVVFSRLLQLAGLDPAEERRPQSGQIVHEHVTFQLETRLSLSGTELLVSPGSR